MNSFNRLGSGRPLLTILLALWFTFSFTPVSASPPGPVDLPEVGELPVIKELPDPFRFLDGSRVNTRADWEQRRHELKRIIQCYSYGHMPPAPENIMAEKLSSNPVFGGAARQEFLLLSMGPDRKIKVNVQMLIPEGAGPFPAIIKNDNSHTSSPPIAEEIVQRGYAVVTYARTDLDPDENNVVGPAQEAYPDHDWATLAVWAWGGMRVLDYLETLDFIDTTKVAITGHSRGGKTALLAGALDERFTLVVPNGSGCGGAGCYRILGPNSESLEAITDPKRFSYWFHPRLRTFAGKIDRLPFDQHFLKALVAPRALLSTDALGDRWANPLGTQITYQAAQEVFDFLGVPEKNGLHFREGGHDQKAEDWRALIDFADEQFFGKETDRDFKKVPFPEAPKAFTWRAPDG
jgi:hypothetical protein